MTSLNRLRWTHSGHQIASGDDDGHVFIYDVGEVSTTFDGNKVKISDNYIYLRFALIFFLFHSFQQLAVPRADEWSRFQNTIQEIQANASSNIGEVGSPKMSPSKFPFS